MKMRNKWIFLVVAVAILITAWRMFPPDSKFEVAPPKTETSVLPSLEPRPSTITLPIYIPITAVKNYLEQSVRKEYSDSIKKRIINKRFLKVSAQIPWSVKRSNLSLSADKNLLLTSNLAGKAKLHVSKLKKVLQATLKGPLSIVAQPEINPNWRFTVPNLLITAKLKKARVRILGVSVSARKIIQPIFDKKIKKETQKLKKRIAKNDFFEVAAKKHWKEMCRSLPLGSGTGLWLEVKPVAARAAQPVIDQGNIRLQLGLDAHTRVVTEQTKPACSFPTSLIIESPKDGRIEITLPAQIDYLTLKKTFAQQLVGKMIGEGISLKIEDINLRPHGSSLLLETRIIIRTKGWVNTRAKGTLYLLAQPLLNADEKTITFSNVELDTSSQNKFVAIVGEAIETILLNYIKSRATFDLKPKLDVQLRKLANAALKGLSSKSLTIDGHVEDIRLTRLDVGPSYLQLVAAARAKAKATIRKIDPAAR